MIGLIRQIKDLSIKTPQPKVQYGRFRIAENTFLEQENKINQELQISFYKQLNPRIFLLKIKQIPLLE